MAIFSPKQIEAFTKSNSRLNIAEGAVSSGKSHIFMYRYLEELRKGPPGAYLLGGKSETTVIRNVLKPMDSELGNIIKYNQSRREFSLWDKIVYVVGANDERAEGKIRGLTLASALLDEATLLPESFFKMTLSRLRVPNAKLFATTNPDSKFHWLKTDFLDKFADDPQQLASFQFKLDDNPYLTDEYKISLKKEYAGLWYRRFIEGEWVQAEGAVYDFFDEEVHVVEKPPTYAKYYVLGVDYGTTNAFAAVLVGFNDDCHPALWVEKEYYWDSKAMGFQKTDAEYARDLEKEFRAYNVKQVYLDPSAASFQTELKRQKWPVLQAKNDVVDGIRCVSTMISQKDLVICKGCINLIKEIEGYVWDNSSHRLGVDKPIKQRDHACLTGDMLVTVKVEGDYKEIPIETLSGSLQTDIIAYDKVFKDDIACNFTKTGIQKKIYKLTLENGKTLRATGDHKVWTKRGYVEIQSLLENDEVLCYFYAPKIKHAEEHAGAYSRVKHIQEDGIEDVYCCVVPNSGNFVANGIVVKNCDALRYAIFSKWGGRMSLKEPDAEERYKLAEQRRYAANPMAYPGFTNSHGWTTTGSSAFD